jgi:metal-responsive CopG/Arc/MetJ family transcriptional regulator
MNTAISIPDPIFETAERLAQTLRISRNELYTRALSTYIEIFDDNPSEKRRG